MALAQIQKYRSVEQIRKPRGESTYLWTLSLTKEKIHYGENTISLTNGAGKTGQPPEKEGN